MAYQIVKATEKDIEILKSLNHELCLLEFEQYDGTINPDFPYTEEGDKTFKKRVADGAAFLVLQDKIALGYLTASISEAESYQFPMKIANVESIFVKDIFRGQGIGTALLEQFKIWSKSRNATRIRVVASAKNIRAIRSYKKFGFENQDIVLEQEI